MMPIIASGSLAASGAAIALVACNAARCPKPAQDNKSEEPSWLKHEQIGDRSRVRAPPFGAGERWPATDPAGRPQGCREGVPARAPGRLPGAYATPPHARFRPDQRAHHDRLLGIVDRA